MQSLEQWEKEQPPLGADSGLGLGVGLVMSDFLEAAHIGRLQAKVSADLGVPVLFEARFGMEYRAYEKRRTGEFVFPNGIRVPIGVVFRMCSGTQRSLSGFPQTFDQTVYTGVDSQGRFEPQQIMIAENPNPFGWRPDKIPVVPSGPGPDVPPYPAPAGKMWTKGLMGWGLADAVDVPAQIGWSIQDRTDLREMLRLLRDARAAGRI